MRHIIVPIDFSEDSMNALEKAMYIADRIRGDITLLHVLPKKSIGGLFSGSRPKGFTREEVEENFQKLNEQYEKDFNILIREGTIYREVSQLVDELKAYMVIMGTHGIGGFQEFWIGSNAYKVVSASSKPVLTLRESFKKKEIDRIVMPIDFSLHTRHKVPITMDMAQFFDAEVHVIGVSMDANKSLMTKLEMYTNQVFDYMVKHHVKAQKEFINGSNITDITIDYAKKIDADLISIMTEQETSPNNFFIGPYAQQMVNHAPIPVLATPPNPDAIGKITY